LGIFQRSNFAQIGRGIFFSTSDQSVCITQIVADVSLLFRIQISVNPVQRGLVLWRRARNFVPALTLFEEHKILASELIGNYPHVYSLVMMLAAKDQVCLGGRIKGN
jgi:hypothetical protein